MNRATLWTVLALVACLCGRAVAQTPVDKRRPASEGGFVDVRVSSGSVQIAGTADREVTAKGTLTGADARLELRGDDDLTLLRVAEGVADLQVSVPANSRLDVHGDSLDVTVSGLAGILSVHTRQGRVRVTDQPREVQVDSRQGMVDVNVTGTRVNVTSMQSRVQVRARHGDVDVSTVSGPVTVNGESISGQIQSVSGDVSVTAAASRVQVSSSSGSVDLNLKGGEADVSTMSGSISAQGDRFDRGEFESYTGRIRFESGPEQNGRLQFKAHDGAVDLRIPGASNEVVVSTQSGPVHLQGDGFDRAWIESHSGNVTFEGDLNDKGALDVQTEGAVDLVLPKDVNARFRITAEGKIQNAFGEAAHAGELDFSAGKGDAWITVKSRGDVWVRKRAEGALDKPRSEADALFDQAMAMSGKTPVEARLEAFRNVLRKDVAYAPAYHEMAKLYMTYNRPVQRQWAMRALREAVRLDPKNVAYQVTLGDLLLAQGFYYNAENQYEQVLSMSPDNAHAAFQIGQYKVREFLKYKDMMNPVAAHMAGGASFDWTQWKGWGNLDGESARVFLTRSIAADRDYRDAYYQLGLLYLENGHPDSLVSVSRQLLAREPNDKDALLFCGLGYQRMGKMDAAFKAYSQALAHMSEAERAMMNSVQSIASESEQKEIASTRGGLARFWKEKDPLYLTDYNEQLLVHYGRIAYANLRFSRPERGIAGWQTDMGKAYIKYGRYLGRRTGRGDVDAGPVPFDQPPGDTRAAELAMSSPSFEVPTVSGNALVEQQTETWFYENFQLSFRLPDGYHGYRISEAPKDARFDDPYQHVKYSVPFQVAAFRERDSIRVELAYALPRAKLGVAKGSVELEDGVFMFTPSWATAYRGVEQAHIPLPVVPDTAMTAADSLHKSQLLSMRQVRIAPGTYCVVAEARDFLTGTIGTFRTDRTFAVSDTALDVSDLLLANKIEARTPFPEVRSDLKVMPNPTRTYAQSEPVFVYLEVYNLARNTFGNTDYEITYRIGSPDADEIDPAQFVPMDYDRGPVRFEVVSRDDAPAFPAADPVALNLDRSSQTPPDATSDSQPRAEEARKREVQRIFSTTGTRAMGQAWKQRALQQQAAPMDYTVKYVLPRSLSSEDLRKVAQQGVKMETAVTAEYEGHRRNDLTYLQVDVSQVPEGVHKLTVQVKDRRTGQTTTRTALFRVVE